MTQTEADHLCVEAQNALCMLMDELLDMFKAGDLNLQRRISHVHALNCCQKAIQNYSVAGEVLSDDQLLSLQQRIIYFSEWRS